MRSAFGSWVVERRLARVALIAAMLPFFGFVSGAIVVCVAMVKGWRESLLDCLIALGIVFGLATMTGDGGPQVLFSCISTWGIALLMGGLVAVYGSLTLAIQALIVLCCAAVIGFEVIVDDPSRFWSPILQAIAGQMQQIVANPEVANAILGYGPIMSGFFGAGTILNAIVALLIGCWWAGGSKGVTFRDMFLGLRLGYVVGGISAVAGIGSLLGSVSLAVNLLLVTSVGFLFQGLAVVHWHVVRRGLPWALLIPVYVVPLLLGPSVFVMALFLYVAVGFVDNWYGLRRG